MLVGQQLLMLLWSELFQEFLLLDGVHLLKSSHELHGLFSDLNLIARHACSLHLTRVHDVLAFTLFFFRWHFVDDLRLSGWILHRVRLHLVLVFGARFLPRVMSTALEGREEVVKKDALAWLHLSTLAL